MCQGQKKNQNLRGGSSMNKITLVSILGCDSNVKETEKAIHHCINVFDFYDIKFISSVDIPSLDKYRVKIPPLSYKEYNAFMGRMLGSFIRTDFCITVQYDGFIIDPNKWTDEFLDYDYIGAPWANEPNNLVGNGGFSLRSKKFLNEARKIPYCSDIMFPSMPPGTQHTPEDWFLCSYSYPEMSEAGVKFAPVPLAFDFSVEHANEFKNWDRGDLSTYDSFGFHGAFNTAGMGVVHNEYNITDQ